MLIMEILPRLFSKSAPTAVFIALLICSAANVGAFSSDNGDEVELFRDLHNANPFWDGVDPTLEKKLVERISIPDYFKEFLEVAQAYSWEELRAILFDGVDNENCEGHVLEWLVRAVTNQTNIFSEDEKWMLQMVDSWGKVPEGILSGHVNAFGDFDECVEIKARNIKPLNPLKLNFKKEFEGQYCLSFLANYAAAMAATGRPIIPAENNADPQGISPRKAVSVDEFVKILSSQAGIMGPMLPSTAICMPNSCSQGEVQRILVNGLIMAYTNFKLDPTKMLYPIAAVCAVQEKPPLKTDDIAVIVLIGTIFVVSVLAGVVDYWMTRGPDKPKPRGLLLQYFMAFSFYTNTKKWMSTRRGTEDMGCIHGIRFFSTSWVVLGHTYAASIMVPAFNMIDVKKIHDDWTIMPILNGAFSVDTFFVMSGMLATYGILKTLEKTKGKLNIVMFYVHRYLRLTPTYAILVGIMATIVVYVGSGPYWNLIVPAQVELCKDKWWTNLLYINNIWLTANNVCHGESWYISNDMQFYILSPFIVYPLWKWPKPGGFLLVVYTILSCLSPALIYKDTDAPPAALMSRPLGKGFSEIYTRPWARIQTYIVGVWLGWIIFKTRGKSVKIPALLVIAGWMASTATVLAVVFSIPKWFDPFYEIPRVSGYFYIVLSRLGFATSVAWVIFACLKGYGGIVNRFLSWSPFMPLGRLTFCVYLSSYYLQFIYHARSTVQIKNDTYNMINLFFAHMVMSFLVGFLLTMLFESPFIILQKLLFEGGARPRPQNPKAGAKGPTQRHGIFYVNTDHILNGKPVAIEMDDRSENKGQKES